MKGVQCYELFGGIALKNHTFTFFSFSLPIVIEVGRLWRCLDLLEVTSMSYVLLTLSLSMFAVA